MIKIITLRFKPNPANLLSKLDDDSEDENEDEEAFKNPSEQKFKPPMNVPQYYMEGRGEDKGLEEGEKSKKRAISKSIMESIKEQYLDTPEEVSHKVGFISRLFFLAIPLISHLLSIPEIPNLPSLLPFDP